MEGRSLYRTSEQMREGRIFKGMEKMSWFKSKRGGGDKREAKEVPTILKETLKKWAGKGRK